MLKPLLDVKSPEGKIIGKEFNPLLDYIWEHWLAPDSPNNPVALGALGESGKLPISTTSDGAFEAEDFVVKRTGEALIKIEDPGRKMNLMNDWIHLDTIAGSGLLPFILPSSIFIPSTSAMTINLRDISGAPNTVYFVMNGRKIYKNAPKPEIDDYFEGKGSLVNTSFFLTADGGAVTIPAVIGSTTTVYATIPSGFDLLIKKITAMSTGDYLLTIKHNGTPLMNTDIADDLMTGTAALPKLLREPKLIRRNEQLELKFTNAIAGANTVYITFSGVAVFPNIE